MSRRSPCAWLAVSLCLLSPSSKALAVPRIACDEPVKDFGILNNNTQSLDHTFTVWNRGDSDLQIQGVHSSCGCTTANAGDNTLKPGASTPIRVRFTLAGRRGSQKKEIRVTSSDPLAPQTVLLVACDIRLDIETDVSGFFFSRVVNDSQTVSRTVSLRAASNVTFNVTSVDISAAPSVIVDTRTVETGRVYAITATVRMDDVSAGMTQERLTVHTDLASFPRIDLPVSLYKAEEVMVIPNELPLLESVLKQPVVRRDLYLRIQGSNRWEFFDVEPVGNFSVAVEEMVQGRCRILLSNLDGVDESGTLRLAVTVRSQRSGAERRIEVRLRRYAPKKPAAPSRSHATGNLGTGTFREVKKIPPPPSP